MAWQNYYDVYAGIAKGSVWGTAVDTTTAAGSRAHFTSIAFDIDVAKLVASDNAVAGRYDGSARDMELTVPVTISGEGSFGQSWQYLLGALMGSDTVGAETTVSQGDYPHTFDLESDCYAKFLTIAWSVEDDTTIELPSVKISSFQWDQEANKNGKWTATGFADRVMYSNTATVVNTYAKVSALTLPNTFELAILAGTNSYLRLSDYSTGTPLSSTHDKEIRSFSVKFDRALEQRRALRGANTQYLLQPRQPGKVTGTLSITFNEVDKSKFDALGKFLTANTTFMCEIMQDGAQIGTGVNTSIKMQFPYAKFDSKGPKGYGWDGPQWKSPSIDLRLYAPAVAANGMAGLLKPARIKIIDHKTTAYI